MKEEPFTSKKQLIKILKKNNYNLDKTFSYFRYPIGRICELMKEYKIKLNTKIKKFEYVDVSKRHNLIKKQYGKADKCELNLNHKSKIYNWANINHLYLKNIKHWIRLCPKCHRKFDKNCENVDVNFVMNLNKYLEKRKIERIQF